MTIQDTHAKTPLRTAAQLWATEADCTTSAARLAAALASHHALSSAYVELHGPLGAGKTTFTRHLLQALGVTGRIKSPTYAVMESYEVEPAVASEAVHGAIAIRHFDFYRFADPQEWEDAGFRDAFAAPGLKLAEWPEKAAGLLPVADLRIDIAPDVNHGDVADVEDGEEPPTDQRRVVHFTALTALGLELLP